MALRRRKRAPELAEWRPHEESLRVSADRAADVTKKQKKARKKRVPAAA